MELWLLKVLGPVYTERERQCCDSVMMMLKLIILLSLKQWSHFRMGLQPIVFNQCSIASMIAALTLTLGVNCPLLV